MFLSDQKNKEGIDMNSSFSADNFTKCTTACGKENSMKLIACATAYKALMDKGDTDGVRKLYPTYLEHVKEAEKISGVKLVDSPDGSYIMALSAMSAYIYGLVKAVKEEEKPKRKTKAFSDIDEADEWMSSVNNIIVTDMKVNSSTIPGLFANHDHVNSVYVTYEEYSRSVGYLYVATKEEVTKVFIPGNTEKYKSKWRQQNPGCEIVSMSYSSHSRGDDMSLALGFGNKVENISYYVLYREKVNITENKAIGGAGSVKKIPQQPSKDPTISDSKKEEKKEIAMIRFCVNCGKKSTNPNARFCAKCGEGL